MANLLCLHQTLCLRRQHRSSFCSNLQHLVLAEGGSLSRGGVGGDAPPPAVAHISLISQDLCEEVVTSILSEVRIPEYSPSDKVSIAPGVWLESPCSETEPSRPRFSLSVRGDRRDGKEAWPDQDARKQRRGARGHHSPGAGDFCRGRLIRWWKTLYPPSQVPARSRCFKDLLLMAGVVVQRGCRWARCSLRRTMTTTATWTLLRLRLLWGPECTPSSPPTDSRPNASLARSFPLLPRQQLLSLDWWESLWCDINFQIYKEHLFVWYLSLSWTSMWPCNVCVCVCFRAQVALELIKLVGGQDFESFRNCFFNLAIPVVVLTEPAKVKRTMIRLEHSAVHFIFFILLRFYLKAELCLLASYTENVALLLKPYRQRLVHLFQRQHLFLYLGLLDHFRPWGFHSFWLHERSEGKDIFILFFKPTSHAQTVLVFIFHF